MCDSTSDMLSDSKSVIAFNVERLQTRCRKLSIPSSLISTLKKCVTMPCGVHDQVSNLMVHALNYGRKTLDAIHSKASCLQHTALKRARNASSIFCVRKKAIAKITPTKFSTKASQKNRRICFDESLRKN